jgi:ABC-2 type transport system ATP-binding protein
LSDPKASHSSATIAIRVRGLSRRFGTNQALAPIDIDIAPGEIVGLIGPNGSGKSTLLRCLTGVVRKDTGEISIDGEDFAGDGANIRRRVTYSPGEVNTYGELSGSGHLAWLLRGRDKQTHARAHELAADLGLPLRSKLRTYSHGMKRQLLFAAAIAPAVRVRLLDEITEGLDPAMRATILDQLRADADAGNATLLSSHHFGEVDRVCDRLIFLDAGKKLAEESPATIAERARVLATFEYADPDAARAANERLTAEGTHADHTNSNLLIQLDKDDPQAHLARLLARTDLPAPTSVLYGQLPLADLYRELYGREAC